MNKIIPILSLTAFISACGGTAGGQFGSLSTTDTGQAESTPSTNRSPFGIQEMHFTNPRERTYFNDINAQVARLSPDEALVWGQVEDSSGNFDWTTTDEAINLAQGTAVLVTVGGFHHLDFNNLGKLPDDMDGYLNFLKKAVERYDADGIDDADGSPYIEMWQIGNEVDGESNWVDTAQNYAYLLKESSKVIKEANPDAKVVIAGVSTPDGYYSFYNPVLTELDRIKDSEGDQYIDIFDLHWSGQWGGDYDYKRISSEDANGNDTSATRGYMKNLLSAVKEDLSNIGYANMEYHITEMSDYSDTPEGYDYTSEAEHAASLIRRYVYPLSSGFDSIYWTQMIEWHNYGGTENGYFDNVGLVNNSDNDGKSHKKLAYYTYKKMVEVLDGSDWDNVETVRDPKGGIHVYKFLKDQTPVWVTWNDGAEGVLELPGIGLSEVTALEAVPNADTGDQVTDYDSAFVSNTYSLQGGTLTVTVGDTPLYIY